MTQIILENQLREDMKHELVLGTSVLCQLKAGKVSFTFFGLWLDHLLKHHPFPQHFLIFLKIF